MKNFACDLKTYKEVLKAVDTAKLSKDGRQVLGWMKQMAKTAQDKQVWLYDVNQYTNSVLWEGTEDVDYVLSEMDSDAIPESLELGPKEKEAMLKNIAAHVDWEDKAFVDCSRGNELIEQAITEYFDAFHDEYFPDLDNLIMPGDTIKHWMEYTGVDMQLLSSMLEISPEKTKDLLDGKTLINEEMAGKLEYATYIPAKTWLKREKEYRECLEKHHEQNEL